MNNSKTCRGRATVSPNGKPPSKHSRMPWTWASNGGDLRVPGRGGRGLANFQMTWLTACFCLMMLQVAQAQQNFVVFSATFETFPNSSLNEPLPASPNLKTRLGNFKTRLAFPIAGSGESASFLIGRVFYERLEFAYTDNQLVYSPENLQELGVELSWRRRLGNRWFLGIMGRPNLASDFENVDGDHVNLDAGIIFSRQSDRTSRFGFGVRYTTAFGEPLVLPVLIYNRRDENSYAIDVLLPKHAELMLLPGPSIEVGFAARVSGNHYRIGQEVTLASNVSLTKGRVKYSVVTLGPAFRFGISQAAFITIEGGVALARRFELFTENDTKVNRLDLERSFSLRAGLQLRR